MLSKSIVRAVGGTLMLASLMHVPTQATANPLGFSQVIAFGDSLTDIGRFFALSTTYFGPGQGLPQVPYWNGRFADGPIAVELLADGLGVTLNDYAYGGANSGFGGQLPGTGLRSQVGLFADDLGLSPADPNALLLRVGRCQRPARRSGSRRSDDHREYGRESQYRGQHAL